MSRTITRKFLTLLKALQYVFKIVLFIAALQLLTGQAFGDAPDLSVEPFGAAEQKVYSCGQSRSAIKELIDKGAVSDATPKPPARRTMKALYTCELESQKVFVALKENTEKIPTEMVFCDDACSDVSPEYACFNDKDYDFAFEVVESRQRAAERALDAAKSCRSTFISMCSGDLKDCENAARGDSTKDKALSQKFNNLVLNTEVANRGLLSGKELLDTIKEIHGQSNTTTTGETTVQQNPSRLPSQNSAAALGSINNNSNSAKPPGDDVVGKASVDKESGLGSGLKKLANPGALALGASLRNQYQQRQDGKKADRQTNAALERMSAAAARKALASQALLVGEKDPALGGGQRIRSGVTGAGGAGGPGGARLASLPGNNSGRATGTTANTPSAATGAPGPSASATGDTFSSGAGRGGGSLGNGGTSSGSGQGSRSAAAGRAESGLSKYTADRGTFGLGAGAGGAGKKKKNGRNQGRRVRTSVRSSTEGGGQNVAVASQQVTESLNKRWNKALGRVEEGASRSVASVRNGGAVGVTEKNHSIFNSICSRYIVFQKDGHLKFGRSVCPQQ